jgi:hypothetical protein
MPTVPRYEQGQVRQQVAPTPQISRAPSAAFGADVGAALGNVANTLGQVAEQERNRMDTAAVMEAEAQLRTVQNGMLFGENGAYRTKGKDSFGLPERVLPEYDKSRDAIAMNLRGRQKELFEQRTATWRPQMEGDMMRYVARESETYTANTTKAYIESAGQTALLYYNDPAKVDGEIARAQDAYIVGNPGEPPEATTVAMRQIDSTIRKSIVDRLMTDSPVAAQTYFAANKERFTGTDTAQIERVLKPLITADQGERLAKAALAGAGVRNGPATFDAVMEQVLADEGGYVNDPVDRGGETNFGISKGANPDVDVRNLTREKAIEIYRARYWDKINADALPEDIRATAMDAAVNQGVGWTKRALAASGGDVATFNAMRKDRYDEIVRNNPSQRKFYNGWMNRLAGYTGTGDGQPGVPRSYADAKQFVLDSGADDEVKKAAIADIEMRKDLERERESETEKAMIESINAKVENASPSTPFAKIVTPQELAWAQESGRVGAWEARMRARVTGTDTDTAPDLLLAFRDVAYKAAKGDVVAKRELASYKPYDPKLRMSQADRDWLARAQADVGSGDPTKIARTATEGEINTVIKQYSVSVLGVPEKQIGKNTEAGQRAWQFQNDLRAWVDQFARDNKRDPTYTEVTEQADLMTLNNLEFTYTSPGMLWDSEETTTVAKLSIPAEAQAQIVQALRTEGKDVTGANVAAKWQAYLAKRGAQ